VIMNRTIAVIHERQRLMFENYFAFIIPFIVITCAVWIGVITLLNVRDRRQEIGILRALGTLLNIITDRVLLSFQQEER
jgi:putative ABC transport system permease protein